MVTEVTEALKMIDGFVSVGVKWFSLTCTDIAGRKVANGYWAGRNLGAMRFLLPHLVPRSWQLHQNLIVRPQEPAGIVLAQLDDLNPALQERMASKAFLVVETSPGNYQVWLAIRGSEPGLVSRLIRGIGSDSSASRAGRLAGTPNCKPKYDPNFPMVRVFKVESGRFVLSSELQEFLAPVPSFPKSLRSLAGSGNGWPDYEWVLRGAPRKKDGTSDRSRADFFWCKLALARGHSQDAVARKLAQVSERAHAEIKRGNAGYLRVTVDAAFAAK